MILFKTILELKKYIIKEKAVGKSIGFVPTMGALHQGHISLIEMSKQQCELTVSSIFVNPTQFNDPADYQQYPITIEKDIFMLEQAGCDALLLPSVQEIYPDERHKKKYDLGLLEQLLEGKYRPGHFQGVCQVVNRLLEIVEPDLLFLGRKDYQQCMVIEKLIQMTDSYTKLVIASTKRETSGLAMSSRNIRLSETDRENAKAIYASLNWIKENLHRGSVSELTKNAEAKLLNAGFDRIDYISIAHAHTLEPIEIWDGSTPLVALVAAFLSGVRLIDNIPLTDGVSSHP
jgi:pantoate--beta-alanine ligase